MAAIPLGDALPRRSSDQPGRSGPKPPRPPLPLRARERARRPYSVLLRVGFAMPPPLPAARCALTAPFHPCLASGDAWRSALCGTFPKPPSRPKARQVPGGRYPPPSFRGARTFLDLATRSCRTCRKGAAARPPGRDHLARPMSRSNSSSNRMPPSCPSISPSIRFGRQRRSNARTAARPSAMS